MVIQEEGEARDKLVEYLKAGGAEVICSRPVWPGFFFMAKEERPDAVVVDCSPPGYGRECAGYLGETGFTRHMPVQIGRASCRERVEISVAAARIKNKHKQLAHIEQPPKHLA